MKVSCILKIFFHKLNSFDLQSNWSEEILSNWMKDVLQIMMGALNNQNDQDAIYHFYIISLNKLKIQIQYLIFLYVFVNNLMIVFKLLTFFQINI